jgi:hypothetical protein
MSEEELFALDVVMSPLFHEPQVSGVFEIKEWRLVCIDEELCYC